MLLQPAKLLANISIERIMVAIVTKHSFAFFALLAVDAFLTRESRVLVMHSYGIFACFECLADLR
jgi:hypothetical protein